MALHGKWPLRVRRNVLVWVQVNWDDVDVGLAVVEHRMVCCIRNFNIGHRRQRIKRACKNIDWGKSGRKGEKRKQNTQMAQSYSFPFHYLMILCLHQLTSLTDTLPVHTRPSTKFPFDFVISDYCYWIVTDRVAQHEVRHHRQPIVHMLEVCWGNKCVCLEIIFFCLPSTRRKNNSNEFNCKMFIVRWSLHKASSIVPTEYEYVCCLLF